jgi:hypothetical protein
LSRKLQVRHRFDEFEPSRRTDGNREELLGNQRTEPGDVQWADMIEPEQLGEYFAGVLAEGIGR